MDDSSSITGTTPLSRITLGCLEDLGMIFVIIMLEQILMIITIQM